MMSSRLLIPVMATERIHTPTQAAPSTIYKVRYVESSRTSCADAYFSTIQSMPAAMSGASVSSQPVGGLPTRRMNLGARDQAPHAAVARTALTISRTPSSPDMVASRFYHMAYEESCGVFAYMR